LQLGSRLLFGCLYVCLSVCCVICRSARVLTELLRSASERVSFRAFVLQSARPEQCRVARPRATVAHTDQSLPVLCELRVRWSPPLLCSPLTPLFVHSVSFTTLFLPNRERAHNPIAVSVLDGRRASWSLTSVSDTNRRAARQSLRYAGAAVLVVCLFGWSSLSIPLLCFCSPAHRELPCACGPTVGRAVLSD